MQDLGQEERRAAPELLTALWGQGLCLHPLFLFLD